MTHIATLNGLTGGLTTREITRSAARLAAERVPSEVPNAAPNQVALDTLMVGNLAEKSFALTAIFTATWRATAL